MINYEKWYWILREYIGEESWTDLYNKYGDEEE